MGRNFKNWIDSYLEFTDNSESPYMFRLWSAISSVSAVLERKCYFLWDKRQYLNMYIVIVGPSGVRKGTAISPAIKLLKAVDVKLSADSLTREALIRELNKSKQDHLPDGKISPHSSMTIFSPELSVFLGYQNNQLMMDLTDWFDSPDDWTYRIKTGPSDEITGVWVNFFGATTPQMLKASLSNDAIGGGLTSRIIFIYEDKRGKRVLFPFAYKKDEEFERMLIEDLSEIKSLQGEFRFTEDFLSAYADWFQSSQEPYEESVKGTFLEAYATRRQIHHIKLACILNASYSEDMIVSGDDFNAAAELMRKTEINMPKTFSGVGENPDALVLSRLITFLQNKKEVDLKEVVSRFQFDAPYEKLIAMLQSIKATGAISIKVPENNRNNWEITWIKE